MIRHIDEGDYDAEEPKNVHNQNDHLDAGQQVAGEQVHDQCETERSPNNQCSFPGKSIVEVIS